MTDSRGEKRSRLGPVWVVVASALCAMALVVGVIVLWPTVIGSCGGWFSTKAESSTGECVGVLHGDDLVDDTARGRLIARFSQANDAVAASPGAYVKIVLLTPLSVAPDGSPVATSEAQILSSLEGAYTAMQRANQTGYFGSPNAPRLQVILANQGSRQQDSDAVVSSIVAESEPEHPVVAVVGLGSSFPGTIETAKKLSDQLIPTVSAVASADTFDASAAPGLHSASPSNSQYVRALRSFLGAQGVLRSGGIVADQNEDPYTRSLRRAFDTELAGFIRIPDRPFNGSTVESGTTPEVFSPVVTNLCNAVNAPDPSARLDTVLYAGRVADFKNFVSQLGSRDCRARPLAILVGATGFDAARAYEGDIQRANATVIYATSADTVAWAQGKPGTPAGFPPFLEEYRKAGFVDTSLGDGYAVMYHDAVAAAAVATRLAALGNPVPRAADVNTQFGNVVGSYAVNGASGTLSFPTPSDGRAVGKVIPLRQIGASALITLPENGCVYVVGGPCIPR